MIKEDFLASRGALIALSFDENRIKVINETGCLKMWDELNSLMGFKKTDLSRNNSLVWDKCQTLAEITASA